LISSKKELQPIKQFKHFSITPCPVRALVIHSSSIRHNQFKHLNIKSIINQIQFKNFSSSSIHTSQVQGLPEGGGLFSSASAVLIETTPAGRAIGIPGVRLSVPSAATSLALLITVTFSPTYSFRLSKMSNKNENTIQTIISKYDKQYNKVGREQY
jgi:hypothetical protein